MAILPNIWHLRKVADTSSRPCIICYKPTTSVLVTPDSELTSPEKKKDFFYTCDSHLKDRGFAIAKINPEEEAAKKKKQELEAEIEKVKKEYEEKMKAKKKKKKGWFGKDEDKDKEKEKEKDGDDGQDEKERDDKIKALEKSETKVAEGPRVFELHKDIYQMRLSKIQATQLAKRKQEQLRNPTLFPTVPSGNP